MFNSGKTMALKLYTKKILLLLEQPTLSSRSSDNSRTGIQIQPAPFWYSQRHFDTATNYTEADRFVKLCSLTVKVELRPLKVNLIITMWFSDWLVLNLGQSLLEFCFLAAWPDPKSGPRTNMQLNRYLQCRVIFSLFQDWWQTLLAKWTDVEPC